MKKEEFEVMQDLHQSGKVDIPHQIEPKSVKDNFLNLIELCSSYTLYKKNIKQYSYEQYKYYQLRSPVGQNPGLCKKSRKSDNASRITSLLRYEELENSMGGQNVGLFHIVLRYTSNRYLGCQEAAYHWLVRRDSFALRHIPKGVQEYHA